MEYKKFTVLQKHQIAEAAGWAYFDCYFRKEKHTFPGVAFHTDLLEPLLNAAVQVHEATDCKSGRAAVENVLLRQEMAEFKAENQKALADLKKRNESLERHANQLGKLREDANREVARLGNELGQMKVKWNLAELEAKRLRDELSKRPDLPVAYFRNDQLTLALYGSTSVEAVKLLLQQKRALPTYLDGKPANAEAFLKDLLEAVKDWPVPDRDAAAASTMIRLWGDASNFLKGQP